MWMRVVQHPVMYTQTNQATKAEQDEQFGYVKRSHKTTPNSDYTLPVSAKIEAANVSERGYNHYLSYSLSAGMGCW
jgi:hypothetical protein